MDTSETEVLVLGSRLETATLECGGSPREVASKLNIPTEGAIVKVNGTTRNLDHNLTAGDTVYFTRDKDDIAG